MSIFTPGFSTCAHGLLQRHLVCLDYRSQAQQMTGVSPHEQID